MTTSISSEALTDRRTKYLENRCSYMRGIYKEEIRPLSQFGGEKIAFPPKYDIRTDISNYRVASLIKINSPNLKKRLKI